MKKFKKYPVYKDSGIDWIGEIPEHWEVRKLKYITSIYNGNSLNDKEKVKYESYNFDDITYLSSKDINSETLYANYNNGLRIPVMELSNFKVAPQYSTLLCIEGGSAGKKITYLQEPVCFVNKLACFNSYKNTDTKYIYFSLQSSVFKSQFNLLITGLIGGVSLSNLKNCNIPFPSLSEQNKIASFLDKKTAEIDKAIELKQKENELLKERRHVAINQAVTRGLHPNVEYKDSGIDWIGEIPEHWEVRKLKYVGEIKNGATPSSSVPSFWDGNIVWVTPADINDKMYTSISKRNITYKGYQSCGTTLIDKGAVILTTRAPVGKVTIANVSLCTNQGCKSIVLSNSYLSEYAYYYLSIQKEILESMASGTTFLELSTQKLADFIIPFPPLSEQKEIAEYLEELDGKTNRLLELNNRTIAKLKEYKQVLIDQAVRGQICLV